MGELVSGRALADAFGVTEGAVRKAAKAGRIPRAAQGKYDLDACRKSWKSKTDPARSKVREPANRGGSRFARGPQSAPEGPRAEVRTAVHRSPAGERAEVNGERAPGNAAAAVRTPDDARAAVALIRAVLTAEGADAGTIDFNAARTAETIVRTYARNLELQQRRGELVEIEKVGAEVERVYAVVRGRLLIIPGKLAAHLVGLDLQAIRLALDDEIREALTELHAPSVEAAASAAPKRSRR